MESNIYRVEVACRERSIFLVEAADSEAAKEIASARWRSGERSDVAGFDWRELDAISVSGASDPVSQVQDDQLVLRFVRERENLLLKLGSPLVSASANDAISAVQTASDLGWFRSDGTPDTLRAAEALERLCGRKQLISFRRTRVRANERGEILLYCTPSYLEELASELNDDAGIRAVG